MIEFVQSAFAQLSTPLIADACLSLGIALRFAPVGIKSVVAGHRAAGRACPVRHYGSVDVFLEALEHAQPGDVLVVDNAGRLDEGCVGDLIALEVQAAELSGIVIWGLHRDTADIIEIGFPVFTYGANPAGPQRLDARDPQAFTSARFADHTIMQEDVVFADSDGVLFVPADRLDQIIVAAQTISRKERQQAALVRDGHGLRQQLHFADYLQRRIADPTYSFRLHIKRLGGEIEK